MFVDTQALLDSATQIEAIGTSLDRAAAAIVAVPVMAADEVSAAVSAVFSEHGLAYRQLDAQMAAFRNQLTQTLAANAGMYTDTEDADRAALLEYAAERNRLWQQSATHLGGLRPPGTPLNAGWWVWQLEQVAYGALKLK